MFNTLTGVEVVNVVDTKLDPRFSAWKGMATMARSDMAREMWITAEEWAYHGVKLLREKAPFPI